MLNVSLILNPNKIFIFMNNIPLDLQFSSVQHYTGLNLFGRNSSNTNKKGYKKKTRKADEHNSLPRIGHFVPVSVDPTPVKLSTPGRNLLPLFFGPIPISFGFGKKGLLPPIIDYRILKDDMYSDRRCRQRETQKTNRQTER